MKMVELWDKYQELKPENKQYVMSYLIGVLETFFDDNNEKSITAKTLKESIERGINNAQNR